MHWEYVSKLQLLYPVDEHHGYCPNLWAAAGVASLVTEITAAKISRKCFIEDTIIEEPSSATAHCDAVRRVQNGHGYHQSFEKGNDRCHSALPIPPIHPQQPPPTSTLPEPTSLLL